MLWDATTGLPLTMLSDIAQVVWSPDETRFIAQRTDGSLWVLTSGGTIQTQLPISASTQSPTGSFFWSPDSTKLAYLHDGVVDIWILNS